MTPAQALRCATVVPAGFFGMDGHLGAVEEGMLADLVVLDSNPLADIANVRSIHSVVVGGRYIDVDERLQLLESAALR
jgi:imidazolonepropionase-like amidohydrolase